MAGLVGAVVSFALGFLVYGMLLSGFFEANAGSATGVMRGEKEMLWVPMILGHVSLGFLFAIIYGRWANISTFATGAKAGAVIGLLMATTHNLIMYSTTNISNLTGTVADIAVVAVMSAITGGAVAWFLGRDK